MKIQSTKRRKYAVLFLVLLIGLVSLFASVSLAATAKVVDVKVAINHGIALLNDGTAWTFGRNGIGQLGNGKIDTSEHFYPPEKIMNNVKAIDANNAQTALIKTDGTLWMCGLNEDGELGDGTTTNRSIPVKIMDDVQQVSIGSFSTAILKTDGSLWITGERFLDMKDQTIKPVKVMDDVKSVCVGYYRLFYIKKDNSLWACGSNSFLKDELSSGSYSDGNVDYGALGIGLKGSTDMPVQVMTDVKAVDSDWNHVAILKTDGTLWMSGSNDYGELCDGTTTNRHAPVKIMDGVQKVSVGNHNTMVQKVDGSIWVCGKLGNNETSLVPVKLEGLETTNTIDAGSDCLLIVDENGSLWATLHYGYTSFAIAHKSIPMNNSGKFRMNLLIGDNPDSDTTSADKTDSSTKNDDDTTDQKSLAPATLVAPKEVKAVPVDLTHIEVTWSEVSGAKQYIVRMEEDFSGKYKKTYTTSKTTARFKVVEGRIYRFWVSAGTDKTHQSELSKEVISATLGKTSVPSIKINSKSSKKVDVIWKYAIGASGYQYQVATKKKNGKNVYKKTTSKTSVTLKVEKGKALYYRVRPYTKIKKKTVYGTWSGWKKYTLEKKKIDLAALLGIEKDKAKKTKPVYKNGKAAKSYWRIDTIELLPGEKATFTVVNKSKYNTLIRANTDSGVIDFDSGVPCKPGKSAAFSFKNKWKTQRVVMTIYVNILPNMSAGESPDAVLKCTITKPKNIKAIY